MFTFEVKIPESGPYTRTHAWGLFGKLQDALSTLRRKVGRYRYDKDGPSPLTDDEQDELTGIGRRISALAKQFDPNVLDLLAEIPEEDDRCENDKRFPRHITELLDDYHGDVRMWERRHDGDRQVLALVILDETLGPDGVGDFIRKYYEPDSRYGDWWSCPRCDDGNPGSIDDEECHRCYGWGYIPGQKPDYAEYDRSQRGRLALNHGEDWTDEQEAAEQERLKL